MNTEEEKERSLEEIKLRSPPQADWVITIILYFFVTVGECLPFKISSQFNLYFAKLLRDPVNFNKTLNVSLSVYF